MAKRHKRKVRRALETGMLPMRYGMCADCKLVGGYPFTGHKSTIRCTNRAGGYPGAGCRGKVYLPNSPSIQAEIEAAYRIGGPEAARPMIEAYYQAWMA